MIPAPGWARRIEVEFLVEEVGRGSERRDLSMLRVGEWAERCRRAARELGRQWEWELVDDDAKEEGGGGKVSLGLGLLRREERGGGLH